MTQRATAQTLGADHAQTTLKIRVQVVPFVTLLPQTPAPPSRNVDGVSYDIPDDARAMSVSEEIRSFQVRDQGFPSGISDGILKTVTIVAR